jgi:hypothetical protein
MVAAVRCRKRPTLNCCSCERPPFVALRAAELHFGVRGHVDALQINRATTEARTHAVSIECWMLDVERFLLRLFSESIAELLFGRIDVALALLA